MDTHADHACCAFGAKRRKAEPYLFFFGVVLAVAIAICAVTREAFSRVGPISAQHPAPAAAH